MANNITTEDIGHVPVVLKTVESGGVHTLVVDAGGGAASVKDASLTPRGDQQITIASLASVQALSVPANATMAVIQNNTTQSIRYRDSGQDPTASSGLRLAANDQINYTGALASLRLIREADGTGTLDISYYS